VLRLSIFGTFRVADAFGSEIPIKSRKARALLAYLALPPGKPRSREQIMALLWSERGDQQARSSLRQALSGLRKDLDEDGLSALQITDESLTLDPARVIVDPAAPGDVLLDGLHLTDPAFEEWLRDERLRHEDAAGPETQPPERPLPDKPSLAVLPFVNISGDEEQEYFADGITEDIITELSRFHSLFVIARNSSFHYKGAAPKAQDVGHELGVAYIVEGSVRKAGGRVRVTAQLVESESGNHVWAERYDRDLEDIFAVQDELVRTIVSTVGGRLDYAGERRAERLSESDLQAYEHVLRANAYLLQFTREANAKAREQLERAVELDTRSSQAFSTLASAHWLDWMAHWVKDREKSLALAYDCAKKAVALDDTDSTAYARLGMCHLYHRAFDDARHCFERALMLNPNDYYALGFFGFYLTAVGQIDNALTNFDQSARINPLQPEWFNWLRGIAFFTARRYDDAIEVLRPIKDAINEVRGWLAASYVGAGRLDEARAMLAEFLRCAEEDMAVFPGRKLVAWEPFWHGAIEYKNEADFKHLYDALRKAGLED
jgi:adenylate cyclase